MRLPIVIPGNYFQELGTKCENFVPAIIPEKVGGEYPVLAVWNFLNTNFVLALAVSSECYQDV